MTKDTLNIKEWAKSKDKELRSDIDYYISQGIDKKTAVDMVLKSSTIGAGYASQIRYDYLGFQIPNDLIMKGK